MDGLSYLVYSVIILYLFFIGLSIAALVFWILMIIDAVKREYPKSDDKILWVLVIVLVGFVGALIYYFVVKREEKQRPKQ